VTVLYVEQTTNRMQKKNAFKNITKYFGLQRKKMLFLLAKESTALILVMATVYKFRGLLLFKLSVLYLATLLRGQVAVYNFYAVLPATI
jgi:hypothetical protein